MGSHETRLISKRRCLTQVKAKYIRDIYTRFAARRDHGDADNNLFISLVPDDA